VRNTGSYAAPAVDVEDTGDSHLRSTHEVTGYPVHTNDGEIGRVEDFIVDDETWTIRYLVVDTRNWWPGKKVPVSPQWIKRVNWSEANVFVSFSRDAVKHSPDFTEESLMTRDDEAGLYRHDHHEGYWSEEFSGKSR